MDKEFDYQGAVAELEKIAERVADPASGLDVIEKDIKRSAELLKACREYLRGARERMS